MEKAKNRCHDYRFPWSRNKRAQSSGSGSSATSPKRGMCSVLTFIGPFPWEAKATQAKGRSRVRGPAESFDWRRETTDDQSEGATLRASGTAPGQLWLVHCCPPHESPLGRGGAWCGTIGGFVFPVPRPREAGVKSGPTCLGGSGRTARLVVWGSEPRGGGWRRLLRSKGTWDSHRPRAMRALWVLGLSCVLLTFGEWSQRSRHPRIPPPIPQARLLLEGSGGVEPRRGITGPPLGPGEFIAFPRKRLRGVRALSSVEGKSEDREHWTLVLIS